MEEGKLDEKEDKKTSHGTITNRAYIQLVLLGNKIGVDFTTNLGKIKLFLIVIIGLFALNFIAMQIMDDPEGNIESFNHSEFSSSSSSSGNGVVKKNVFEDDEDSGVPGGGEDAGGGEEEEREDEGGNANEAEPLISSAREKEIEALKPKQTKLFSEKDKVFLKFFSKYRKESEIAAHFQLLSDTYKDLNMIKTSIIGTTSEKRKILAYSLGKGSTGRSILIVGTEKGNDWLGAMSLSYFAMRLLQKFSLTPSVTEVMERITIHLVPVLNPDGLVYATSSSSKTHREWYMNRALNAEKKHGVDISSDFEAFSQLESNALKSFGVLKKDELHAFANVKCCSGGDKVGVYLGKKNLCLNPSKQKNLGSKMAEAMGKLGSYQYKFDSNFEDASTSSTSYFHNELGLGVSFGLVVHPTSGASSPSTIKSSDILTATQNVTMGLLELAKFVSVDGAGVKHCKEVGEDAAEEESEGKTDSESDSESNSDEETGEQHEKEVADAHEQAKEAPITNLANEDEMLQLTLKFVGKQGVQTPALKKEEIPQSVTEDYFLYFAYGPDMVYDVLLKGGLTTAWKVVNGRLPGYTFDFTYHSNKRWKSGIADIVKSAHSSVYGVIWKIHSSQLPLLLTWQAAGTETSPMGQKVVMISDLEGNLYKCITFYVIRKSKGEEVLGKYHRFPPSRQYRNCILKGARQAHLPYDYTEHKLKSRLFSPLFTDKIGSTGHRNPVIGDVCDPE